MKTNNSLPKLIYRYRCRKCQHDISIMYLKCASCGLTSGEFETDHPNHTYQTVCSICRQELSIQALPLFCQDCGATNMAWWNLNNNEWYQPNLSLPDDIPVDAVWISGKFSGNYIGSIIKAKTITPTNRYYDLTIIDGSFENAIKIDQPPFTLEQDESYPVRQNFVSCNINTPNFNQNIKINVFDFRLHFPEKIAYKEVSKNDTIIGSIIGEAYAYIIQSEKILPTSTLNEETKSTINTNNQNASSSNENSINNIQNTSVNSSNDCFSCWFITFFLIGTGLWICCSWQLALSCVMVMAITCLLSQSVVEIQSSFNRISLSCLLLMLSIFGIGYYGFLLNITHCTNTPIWPLFVPGISLLISAWLSNCFLRTILSGLWLIALLVWCGINQVGNCNLIGFNNNNNVIQPIVNSLNNVADFTTNLIPDADSVTINQISNNLHLITLDQALDNPELLNDCKNHLYLPSATIFGFDQDTIKASMDANLEKIVRIIQKSPPKIITITGYSDSSGDDTEEGFNHNIELSQKRANSVANWLIEKGNIAPEKIDARGAGSKFPLTHVAGQQSLNRRVEIKLNYPNCKP